ncbi:MAG: ribose 5-phosphate isomerase B [Planctomycetes bacterium]|nr:ribose 5-phosphate isomerase B [Planctomycetota bacterium]
MKIALGMDHRGVDVGRLLAAHLPGEGHEVQVLGQCEGESWDYPDVTWAVARAVADGEAQRGILVCGTGIGASIAANKVAGVRAALVGDMTAAESSRRHNDANVLCLAGDALTDDRRILRIVAAWLAAPFDGGRHARRVNKIAAIERGENPVEAVKA